MAKIRSSAQSKDRVRENLGPRSERSFAPDRKGEDSAGAKGKNRKRAVEADRDHTSR